MPREAVQLARAVLAGGHLPWLVRSPQVMVMGALRRFAVAGWTARDVEVAAQSALAGQGFSSPDRVEAPAAYLAWLLGHADPAVPPAQSQDADAERRRIERAARDAAERDAAAAHARIAEQARGGSGHLAVRSVVAELGDHVAHRRADERRAAAIERGLAVERARAGHPIQPPADQVEIDRLCAGGCGTLSPQVLVRRALPRPTPLCDACWEPMRSLWT